MEINQLLREIRRSLNDQTEYNIVPKLPPHLINCSKEELEGAITNTIEVLVEKRGISYIDISGAEMETKIHGVTSWLLGPPYRTCLLLQGNPGTGKTTLLEALYKLYTAGNASITLTTGIALREAFVRQVAGTSCAYEEYKRMSRLCIDELGTEPSRCQLYGTDYTPIQDLLAYRYAKQLPTMITTNLTDDMICERYGKRISDRFAEMCSILRFSGQSYRM